MKGSYNITEANMFTFHVSILKYIDYLSRNWYYTFLQTMFRHWRIKMGGFRTPVWKIKSGSKFPLEFRISGMDTIGPKGPIASRGRSI